MKENYIYVAYNSHSKKLYDTAKVEDAISFEGAIAKYPAYDIDYARSFIDIMNSKIQSGNITVKKCIKCKRYTLCDNDSNLAALSMCYMCYAHITHLEHKNDEQDDNIKNISDEKVESKAKTKTTKTKAKSTSTKTKKTTKTGK